MNLLPASFNIGDIFPSKTLSCSNDERVCQFRKQTIASECCFEGQAG